MTERGWNIAGLIFIAFMVGMHLLLPSLNRRMNEDEQIRDGVEMLKGRHR